MSDLNIMRRADLTSILIGISSLWYGPTLTEILYGVPNAVFNITTLNDTRDWTMTASNMTPA